MPRDAELAAEIEQVIRTIDGVEIEVLSWTLTVSAARAQAPEAATEAAPASGPSAWLVARASSAGPGSIPCPTPSATPIYFDSDGSGDFNVGDQAYTPGTNDPVLAADASVDVGGGQVGMDAGQGFELHQTHGQHAHQARCSAAAKGVPAARHLGEV